MSMSWLLADAVEPADALFEQVGIQRQVPQDQAVRELEVAAFRADLRAQQQARAVGLGEVRGVAIALHACRGLRGNAPRRTPLRGAQRFLQRQHLGLAAADQQELVVRVLLEQGDQRVDARVGAVVDVRSVPAAAGCRRGTRPAVPGACFPRGVGIGSTCHCGQAFRKAADAGAVVAEHRAAGAVAVDQTRRAVRARWRGLVDDRPSCAVSAASPWNAAASGGALGVVQRLARRAGGRRCSTAPGRCPLRPDSRPDRVALRVEQAQAREVAAAAELLRAWR